MISLKGIYIFSNSIVNPIDDGQFQQGSDDAVAKYVNALEANHITVTLRHSRGKDIDAACGQLANKIKD